MGSSLLAFAGVAVALSATPGPAMALVVRNAALDGRRGALLVTLGNGLGVLVWAALAAIGVSALVAASEAAFLALKLVGAAVLVTLGAQALRGRGTPETLPTERAPRGPRAALRDGVVTSLANPKLAVFFVALFPGFVPSGEPVLPWALAMAVILVCVDLVLFSLLAAVVVRARDGYARSRLARRIERVTGGVLIALGVRLAFEAR